jgi:hypothetical protein
MRRVAFRVFRSGWSSWQTRFEEAAEFAGTCGDRLISISHSSDHTDGVVTVRYWQD